MGAVLLDLDGTLIDSLADIAHAVNHCLAEIGAPARPVEAYRGFVGHGTEETVRRAAPAGADAPALATAFKAYYGEHCLDRTRPFDGVPACLEAWKAAGFALGVLSNKPDALTRYLVDALFPAGTFGVIAGERAGVANKPDPQGALELMARLGATPTSTWFVGDTPVDIGTGVAGGMTAIGVSWGFRPPEELVAAGASHVCTTPHELQRLIQEGASCPPEQSR